MRKLISVVIPVYNEQECLEQVYRRTTAVMQGLQNYDYEIVFFDDGSTDASRQIITSLCQKDEHCKAVFFSHNYGYNNTIYYAVQQAKGDCAVLLHADLQNPPEIIPDFIKKWEEGSDAVFGVKNKSKENKLMYAVRTLFYILMNVIFGLNLIAHATDFELVDKSIITALKDCEYNEPFLRALLLKHACNKTVLYYTQDRRVAGKTHFNFKKYYELAISWIVFSSKVLPRRFLCVGLVMFVASILEFCIGFLPHLKGVNYLALSSPLIIRIMFIVFSVVICFISIMAEFLVSANNSSRTQSIVKEDKRIHY